MDIHGIDYIRWSIMTKKSVLTVSDLKVAFGSHHVVDGVGFDLRAGQTLGIVGESGSGKSITSLSIMGLVPPGGEITGGKIQFVNVDGESDLAQLDESQLRKVRGKHISLIFQEPFSALNPTMKCGRQIMEAVETHLSLSVKEAQKHIQDVLVRVGISEPDRIYNSYPHQLSGGQLQRVLIAMAVCCHPDVIIADEPTTALDVTVQKSVLKLFKELQEEFGCALIFISHDLGVIQEIADHVIVMQKGKMVESGIMETVFWHPQHPYTKGLLACRPPLDQRLARLPTVPQFLKSHKSISQTVITREMYNERMVKLRNGKPLMKVNNLNVNYPSKKNWLGKVIEWKHAVCDIHFDMYPGETLGLVGESGSGKSSLGNAILRLNEYGKGEVNYQGQQIYELNSREMRRMRKKMQIIFQDPYSTLNPKMKVGKAIQEVLYVHDMGNSSVDRKEKTISLMEKCGLESDMYDRYPHQFSGGQRQRISIARTLAVNPELIVCDESVSALDVSIQAQILNLLKDLQKEFNLTYLFISHDLSVVRHMSDRIMVMKDGQIVERGDPYLLFDNPQTDYTKKLIEAIPGKSVS